MNRVFAQAAAKIACDKISAFGVWLNTRQGVRFALLVWIAISLIEYVMLGPRSFIWMDDEGDLLVTHYNLLRHFHPGGQYSHLIQSGADAYGSFFYGSAYFSVDQFLLGALPIWLGVAIHKTCVFAFGAWGTYILCRKGTGCSRIAAFAFGALFTVMFYRMQIVTFGTGLNFSLLPLGAYLCVVRSGRPRYYTGVMVYAVVFATFAGFHGIPPMLATLAVTMVLLGKIHVRIAFAGIVVALAFLINNAESFTALISLSPTSARGSTDYGVSLPFVSSFVSGFESGLQQAAFSAPVMSGSILFAGLVSVLCRDWRLLARFVIAFAIPPIAIALFIALPWEKVGLSPIRQAPVGYAVFGLLPMAVLGGAQAVDKIEMVVVQGRLGLSRCFRFIPSAATLCIAAIVLFQYKAHNFQAWLTTAGQSMYATIDNMRTQSWVPSEPFRAISIRHKQMQPEQNIFMSFYGIPMFDAWINLTPIEHAAYWRYGIHKGKNSWGTDLGLDWRFLDGQNRFHYRLGEQVSLSLLALANVRYVFAPVPLMGPNLRYVDGPPHPPFDKGLMKVTGAAADYKGSSRRLTLDRWRWQLGRVFDYGKVYIYEIEGSLPRVYAARDLLVVPDEMDWLSFFAQVETRGPQRTAVVRARDARHMTAGTATADVRNFQLVEDGFDIAIAAPEGGVIVVNAVRQPFFNATVDGVPVPAVSVNGIQTAVSVPPGARELKIRYHRPTAGEKLTDLFCGMVRRLHVAECSSGRQN